MKSINDQIRELQLIKAQIEALEAEVAATTIAILDKAQAATAIAILDKAIAQAEAKARAVAWALYVRCTSFTK
jgi:prefoldin subunit 5